MRSVRVPLAVTAVATALILTAFATTSIAAAGELDGLIAYAIGGGEDPYVMRTVKLDGARNRRLIGPRPGRFRLGPASPEWSPDGKKLLFGGHNAMDQEARTLWYSTASGKRIRRIRLGFRGPPTGRGAITLHGWDWAPNGRRVVFAARRGLAPARLYTISVDGRHRKALSRGWWPEWSSDGRYILFSIPVGDQFVDFRPGKIAVVRPTGDGFRTLTDSSQDAHPRFSPDGQRVIFVRRTGIFDQWRTVDVSGRHGVVVGPDRPSNLGYCMPHWTPDGTRLAVVRLEGEGPNIARFMTMSMTGARARVAFTFPRGYFAWHTICDFSWRPR